MLHTKRAYGGMVTAPHHLASQAGLRVLQEGGNAIEAMVAAAATITVVYPHMNALGGDNFWLIHTPDGKVTGIDACGAAASAADVAFYQCFTITIYFHIILNLFLRKPFSVFHYFYITTIVT